LDQEEQDDDEQLGVIDLKNVNSRDFDFLSFAEIYEGLYNI
jgi:hypothetical protein